MSVSRRGRSNAIVTVMPIVSRVTAAYNGGRSDQRAATPDQKATGGQQPEGVGIMAASEIFKARGGRGWRVGVTAGGPNARTWEVAERARMMVDVGGMDAGAAVKLANKEYSAWARVTTAERVYNQALAVPCYGLTGKAAERHHEMLERVDDRMTSAVQAARDVTAAVDAVIERGWRWA